MPESPASYQINGNIEIHLVTSDLSLREEIHRWLADATMRVRSFAQAAELIHFYETTQAGCVVIDARSEGSHALSAITNLQVHHDYCQPVIVITRCDDVSAAVSAMKLGAVDVIHEPINRDDFVRRIQDAATNDRISQHRHMSRSHAMRAFRSLTTREREVLGRLILGSANKDIAADLGMNAKTASTHRANIFSKLGVGNLVDLIRIMDGIQMAG